MSDLISQSAAYLNAQLNAYASTPFTYRRRSQGQLQIPMVVGGPKIPMFSLLGSVPGTLDLIQQNPENATRSFEFDASLLDFGVGPVPPEQGDEILEAINGVDAVSLRPQALKSDGYELLLVP